MNPIDIAAKVLYYEEGYRPTAYYCSEGYPTIGIGQKIGPKDYPLDAYQFTLPIRVAVEWCKVQVIDMDMVLSAHTFYNHLNDARKAVIISMCYQLGMAGLLKFKKMLKALEDEDYEEAAKQALDSRWARQTPKRANRHAEVIKTGILQDIY